MATRTTAYSVTIGNIVSLLCVLYEVELSVYRKDRFDAGYFDSGVRTTEVLIPRKERSAFLAVMENLSDVA